MGLEHVNTAINEMDQVTQQNAALVEELSADARSLQDQAHDQVEAMTQIGRAHV